MTVVLSVSGVASFFSFLLPLTRGPLRLALPLILLALVSDVARTIFSINEPSAGIGITPDYLLGRMNACFNQVRIAAGLIGTIAGGILGYLLVLRAALLIRVIVGTCGSLYLYCSPLWTLRAVAPREHSSTRAASALA